MIRSPRPAGADDVARHYDELDRFYRELWGEHLHHGLFESRHDAPQDAAARLVNRVAELGGIRSGSEVCDVGCGYGATSRVLAQKHGARVRGITLSGAQVDCARSSIPASLPPGASLHFQQGDWLSNDFDDGAFDVIVAIECLTHMPDQRAFFHQVARTLRPGGRLVVCAWLTSESPGPLARRFLLEPICIEGELPGMGSASETRGFMEEAGLEPLAYHDLSARVRRTWSVSASRLLGAARRDPEVRRLLRDPAFRSRVFARTVFRIWAAYRVGAMRYGLFMARRRPALR
jgi:tocopherol O-methyltransferase